MEGESHYLPSNLKHLRLLRKMSQDQLSFSIGVKRSTYSGWEQGLGEPNCTRLLALARYHRLSIDTLIGSDLRNERPSRIEEWQRAYPQPYA